MDQAPRVDRVLPEQQTIRYAGKTEDIAERFPKSKLNVSGSSALADMVKDYVFFTPAVLYLYGGLSDLAWIDLVKQRNSAFRIFHHKFQAPLFNGLELRIGGQLVDSDWNHVLWAVETPVWFEIQRWLTNIVLVDYGTKFVVRYQYHELAVPDALALERTGRVSFFNIGCFGVTTTQRTIYLESVNLGRPRLKVTGPESYMERYTKALADYKNPLTTEELNLEDYIRSVSQRSGEDGADRRGEGQA